MVILKEYQEKAVNGLLENTYQLLSIPGARQKLVFKAPTGAGKTVTMAAFLNRLSEELPDKLELQRRKATYIWIAPNQLHLQSFNALKNYFAELRSIKPIQFEDVTDGKLKPNEVLFINWQSVNKGKNVFIRENEQGKTLVSYINGARMDDIEIIVILDEAHLFASKGKAAKELLQKIYAKIEIDVSATPLYKSDYSYTIKRHEVVNAEMIKRGIELNPALDAHLQHGMALNQVLLDQALKKREQLKDAYSELGIGINPLLLIQLPNDTQKESVDDLKIKDEVISGLDAKGITVQNNKLAIWLSKEKENLDGLEAPENMTEVLLFKQAIALGWDCPRAAVLLIFRDIKQEVFTIQTVGRILRMPEQKHYPISILNYGYVYTNLSKDRIQVVADDMDYIVENRALRIADYKPIELKSYFINTRLVRNRLGAAFRKFLYQAAEDVFGIDRSLEDENLFTRNQKQMEKYFVDMDVNNIDIPIPRDVELTGEVEIKQTVQIEYFAKTQAELDILFRQFCRNHVGGYAKVDSAPVLEMALKMLFEEYFGINEFNAIKVILLEQNKPKFIEVIDHALQLFEKYQHEKASRASKKVEESKWDVPPERIYNESYQKKPAETHALLPFFERKNASTPEMKFSRFLEENKQFVEWWYKNGDKNKEDFAVTYQDRYGTTRGFFVDFVIKHKNGTIALFDTKTLDSDPEFVNKHNALIEYIESNTTPKKPLMGGIIVPKGPIDDRVWKFAENRISKANDSTGWTVYHPSKYN
jgi:type III restriction enzyme